MLDLSTLAVLATTTSTLSVLRPSAAHHYRALGQGDASSGAYCPWDELCTTDLHLEWRELSHGRVGEYEHATRTIRLDPRMGETQRRAVLCHELRHAAAGDIPQRSSRRNAAQEARADDAAARLLIDVEDLGEAMRELDDTDAVAAMLDVPSDVLINRLLGLLPVERAYLRVRLLAAAQRVQAG